MIFLGSVFVAVNCVILYMACSEVVFAVSSDVKSLISSAKIDEFETVKNARLWYRRSKRRAALLYMCAAVRYFILKRRFHQLLRKMLPPKAEVYVLDDHGKRVARLRSDKSYVMETVNFLHKYTNKMRFTCDSCVEIVHSDEEDVPYRKILFPSDSVIWPLEKNVKKSDKRLLYAVLENDHGKTDVTEILKPWFYETPELVHRIEVQVIKRDLESNGRCTKGSCISLLFANMTKDCIHLT